MDTKSIENRGVALVLKSVSGNGKTTFANYLALINPLVTEIVEADDYFIDNHGDYKFNPAELGKAHEYSRDKFVKALQNGIELVICSNTNTTQKEAQFYINKAKEYNYTTYVLVLEKHHQGCSSHSVPEVSLAKQEQNIKSSLKLR